MVIEKSFFTRNVLEVAPELVGKVLCHRLPDGEVRRVRISETEAYCGESDTACHASKRKSGGKKRSDTLYLEGGRLYVYLCYGVHNLVNIVTGAEGDPQAVLLRAGVGCGGPGLLGRAAALTREHNEVELGGEVWVEDDGCRPKILLRKRVGIDYAEEKDREALWRFVGDFAK